MDQDQSLSEGGKELAGVSTRTLRAASETLDGQTGLAGRELDAEVARLMGWTNVEPDCYTPIGKEWCGDDPEGTGGFYRTGRKIVPHYSESIAAAMEVVAKVDARSFILKRFGGTVEDAVMWNAEFLGPDAIAVGFTAPEAICRAALQVANTDVSSGTTDQD